MRLSESATGQSFWEILGERCSGNTN
jgi:hypothetical protein